MSLLYTTDETYNDPIRYRLTIKSPDEVETRYVYDSFASNNPFALTGINLSMSIGDNGSFSFDIDDTKDRVIKDTVDAGCVVIVQGGRTQAGYTNMMQGIIDAVDDAYDIGTQIKYKFSGSGFGIINNYTILNFVQSASKESITGTQPILKDSSFRIDNLTIKAYESTDVLPEVNSPTLKTRGGFDTSALPKSTKVVIPAINSQYATAASIFDNFAASSGTVLWIDQNRKVFLRSPRQKHSGTTIRPWDITRVKDLADRTSYYVGGWSSTRKMQVGEFFNKIFLTINTDQIINTAPGDATVAATSLVNKDIGVQFIPGTTRLFNVALLLSKKGTGKSSVEDSWNQTGVYGVICRDDGGNRPSDKRVATFFIPYADILATPTVIYKIDLHYTVASIDANALHWIILFKTGIEEENTVLWHHDNDTLTASTATATRYSGTKAPFTQQPVPYTRDDFADGWSTRSQGPVYRYSFLATAKTTLAVSDPVSIKKYTPNRPVEIRVNAPWINDIHTGTKYAQTLLSYGAKLKRVFSKKSVTIPTKLFYPFQLVNIVYPIAGIDANTQMLAEIQSVNYVGSAYDATSPFGSYSVDLTATAYVSHFQRLIVENLVCGV